MAQNLLTSRRASRKPLQPDIRPVTVWVGTSRRLHTGKGALSPKIESRFISGFLQMIHYKKKKRMQLNSWLCCFTHGLSSHNVSAIKNVFFSKDHKSSTRCLSHIFFRQWLDVKSYFSWEGLAGDKFQMCYHKAEREGNLKSISLPICTHFCFFIVSS